MNKIVLIGYMGENPEQKISANGTSVTTFRLSVKKRHGKANGRKNDYFNCVAFKATADYIYRYANSQSKVAVTGEIEIEDYTDKAGVKRYNPKVYVNEAEVLSSTVNAGDFMEQPQGMEGFSEVPEGEVDLPFI